jgi:nitroimidazol reductase NimA-like FMN-containing flavoprotein (pyridoxamine 5'-phosphate oxidase superfamily)
MASSPADVERALSALRAYRTTALATVSADGPHVAGVFFAPEAHAGGIRLVLAVLRDSRKHRELLADPRVAFMCSPGDPSRWVQGRGLASGVEGSAEGEAMLRRLVEHAPGATVFVGGRLPVAPVVVAVQALKVVEELGRPALVVELDPSREAA